MDSLERIGEGAPRPKYRPTVVAGSEAEAQRLRAELPPGTHIEVDRLPREDLNPETAKIQARVEEGEQSAQAPGPGPA